MVDTAVSEIPPMMRPSLLVMVGVALPASPVVLALPYLQHTSTRRMSAQHSTHHRARPETRAAVP